nr:MOB kinase activator 3B isoform X6 [Dromaius novaehollandiae]
MSIALKQVFNKDKTFRPKRKFEPGTQRFELHKRAQASLNPGVDLKAAVQLPSGEDQNDWVAVHVVDFFNRINLIYGTVCEFCTERTCPVMSGGPKYEYRWQDDVKYKKPTALPAPQYMNLLMDWIEVQINNEVIFPTSVAPTIVDCIKSTGNEEKACGFQTGAELMCSLSKEFPSDLQEDTLPAFSGVCSCLHSSL